MTAANACETEILHILVKMLYMVSARYELFGFLLCVGSPEISSTSRALWYPRIHPPRIAQLASAEARLRSTCTLELAPLLTLSTPILQLGWFPHLVEFLSLNYPYPFFSEEQLELWGDERSHKRGQRGIKTKAFYTVKTCRHDAQDFACHNGFKHMRTELDLIPCPWGMDAGFWSSKRISAANQSTYCFRRTSRKAFHSSCLVAFGELYRRLTTSFAPSTLRTGHTTATRHEDLCGNVLTKAFRCCVLSLFRRRRG